MVTAQKMPTAPSVDIGACLTRRQVADLLSVNIATVHDWEKAGLITAYLRPAPEGQTGPSMVTVYDPNQIVAMPARRRKRLIDDPGELHARAFELFDRGRSLRQVVIELRRKADEIEALYEQWLDFGGAVYVLNEAARDELARFVGPFETVDQLLVAVREKLGCTIEATVPEGATDEQIEAAIVSVLDGEDRTA